MPDSTYTKYMEPITFSTYLEPANKVGYTHITVPPEIVEKVGSQSMVVVLDVKKFENNSYHIWINNGKKNTEISLIPFLKKIQLGGGPYDKIKIKVIKITNGNTINYTLINKIIFEALDINIENSEIDTILNNLNIYKIFIPFDRKFIQLS